MEDILSRTFYHNTLENWLISAGIVVLSLVSAKVAYWVFSKVLNKITARTQTGLDDLIVEKMRKPVLMLLVLIGIKVALERLHFTDVVDAWLQRGFILVITLNVTWFVIRVLESVVEAYLVPYSKQRGSRLDDQMLLLIERLMRALVWSIGIIAGLNNAGFDVGALIAGLGIGGLAFALAAQDTIKNIFGGIIIFIDKPFKIGDRIVIENYDGVVEYIGVRSTHIRTLPGTLITIPNARFSESAIDNISQEPARRIKVTLGLTYDTSPEKIQRAMQLLREISQEHDHLIDHQRTVVYFANFGAYSLDITMFYFIRKESDIMETQSVINQRILKVFNDNGLEFAFPTQTVYKKALQ
ncbi:MAG: transporter [Chitinophagales bacterium]|nr:MAG: transporter [Chitinophagales bacterium]